MKQPIKALLLNHLDYLLIKAYALSFELFFVIAVAYFLIISIVYSQLMMALIFKETLDLSGNQFVSFDEDIHSFWTKSLRRLSIARNKLPSIPWSICQLENLSSLDIGRNEIESIPPPNFWSMKSLTKLNLSHNLVSAMYS